MIRISAYRGVKGARQRVLAEGHYSGVGWSRANQSSGRDGDEFFSFSLRDPKHGLVTVRFGAEFARELAAYIQRGRP